MAKTKKPKPKSKTVKQTAKEEFTDEGPRHVKEARYRSFKLQPRLPKTKPGIEGSFTLLARSIKLVIRNWKVFGGITLIYLLCSALFIQYNNLINDGSTLKSTKEALDQVSSGGFGFLNTTSALFLSMIGSIVRNNSSGSNGIQFILILLGSLAVIWSLRQVYGAKKVKVKIRDSLYRGMAPLIPFLLVMVAIGAQLLPATAGVFLYVTVVNNSIAVGGLEKIFWFGILLISVMFSLYLICSSIMALYIVTLENMTPMKALRSARHLVRYRRWVVIRKILFMPFGLLLVAAIVMTPFMIFATKIAPLVFYLLSAFAISLSHSYLYSLYRELINDHE